MINKQKAERNAEKQVMTQDYKGLMFQIMQTENKLLSHSNLINMPGGTIF